MDSKALAEYLDQTRWLLNNGLINDYAKNQFMFYGSIVHKDVRAVELATDVAKKTVNYKIYVDYSLKNKVELYMKLYKATGLIDMWKFKRLLQKEGNLNFQHILNLFVKDYCGPQWSATAEVLDITDYVEGFDEEESKSSTNN